MTTTKPPRLLTCPRCGEKVEKLKKGKGWDVVPLHFDHRNDRRCVDPSKPDHGGPRNDTPMRLTWGKCGNCGRESPMCADVRLQDVGRCHLCSCCRLDNAGKWRVVRS